MPVVTPLIDGPIIGPDLLPGHDGSNINGPCLIQLPADHPAYLAPYQLYFAHHNGDHIRVAAADNLAGPWQLVPEAAITLASVSGLLHDHIASPDLALIDGELWLWLHGAIDGPPRMAIPPPNSGTQGTVAMRWRDGRFQLVSDSIIAPPYLRWFHYDDAWYGISWGGLLLKAEHGLYQPLTPGPVVSEPLLSLHSGVTASNLSPADRLRVRHVAIDSDPSGLVWVYFSCINDQPEQIYRARLATETDWREWQLVDLELVRRPTEPWEGADLPVIVGRQGAIDEAVHALRDPDVVRLDGRCYLLWSVAGEHGLAVGELQ